MLKGALDDFALTDIFRLISLAKKTGRLEVARQAGRGGVFFNEGEVYYAESSLIREPLGQKLIRAGALTEGQLRRALDEHATTGLRLGQVLLAAGWISDRELEDAIRGQTEDAVFDLLRWEVGEFTWDSGERVDTEVPVAVSVENLIMEASRRLDELEIITRKIPSAGAVLSMSSKPPEGAVEINITPDEWRMLVLVNGSRSVADIAGAVGTEEFDALKTLYGLLSAGLVEVMSAEGRRMDERGPGEGWAAAREAVPEPPEAVPEPPEAEPEPPEAAPERPREPVPERAASAVQVPSPPEPSPDLEPAEDPFRPEAEVAAPPGTEPVASPEAEEIGPDVEAVGPRTSLEGEIADDIEPEFEPVPTHEESPAEPELSPQGAAGLSPDAPEEAAPYERGVGPEIEVAPEETAEPDLGPRPGAPLVPRSEEAEPGLPPQAPPIPPEEEVEPQPRAFEGVPEGLDETPRGGLGRTAEETRGGLGRTAEETRGGLGRTAEETRGGLGRTAEEATAEGALEQGLGEAGDEPPAGHAPGVEEPSAAAPEPGEPPGGGEPPQMPHLERSAAARELAGLWGDPQQAAQRPGPARPAGSKPPRAEDDDRRRVEDDEDINRGLISRLIDGVKGL